MKARRLFKWTRLDGLRFQELCANLLAEEGFEVEDQGVGADGGIDILAKERIPLGIGRTQTYRWAVQAKFKRDPNHTVKPSDIGNIGNLLSRFHADGFLLITNGRVTNKTYQEIRAFELDQPKRYSCNVWDGRQIEAKILKHLRLREHFFTDATRQAVLIVEDDRVQLEAFKAALEALDIAIYTATSPQKAVDISRKTKPTLALLDIRLSPEADSWDGFELAKAALYPQIFYSCKNSKLQNEQTERI